MYDCFISYGRKESLSFVRKLNDSLTEKGLNVWLDKNDIPLAVDFQEQINDGILRSSNFIFVISPHSIQSPYCRKEIELAVRLKKRIIPILHVEPEASDLKKHLYPKVAKLNWIYFRENEEDYDEAFSQLIQTVEKHADFVTKHTFVQWKSQLWKKNKKADDYLLFGAERKAAQQWLEEKFENEQAPVEVTNLQCEYIEQSRWLAERYAADVFIIAAEKDNYWAKKLKFALLRAGKTVADRNDTIVGVPKEKLVEYHMASSRHVIYLLSGSTQNDPDCDEERTVAILLNKPFLYVSLEEGAELPGIAGEIGRVRFDDVQIGESFKNRFDELLKLLNQEQDYFVKHQKTLIRARNWQLQKKNPALLLRGNLLQQAQVWLKEAEKRQYNQATQTQKELVEVSLAKQATLDYDVFVAFSGVDSDFARYLNEELLLHAKTTWFEHLFLSKNQFREAVFQGIELSENFVCVLTQDSLRDLELKAQLGHAFRLKKRIIPIAFEPLTEKLLPKELAKVDPIIFPIGYSNFRNSFSELIRALDIDREYVQDHTVWLARALKWQNEQKNSDLLLHGDECREAKLWLDKAEESNKKPEPINLHKDFIGRSFEKLQLQNKRKRQLKFLQHFGMTLVTLAMFVSVYFTYQANIARERAEVEREKANRLYTKASANNLVALARQLVQKNPTIAMRLAEKAEELEKSDAVVRALYDIYNNNYLYRTIGKHKRPINALAYHQATKQALTASDDKTAKLWSLQDGFSLNLRGHAGRVTSVNFSPKGNLYLTASSDKTIRTWNSDGETQKVLSGHEASVNYAEFSPDGKRIISAGNDKTVILWSVTGDMLKILSGHQAAVSKAVFTPDGKKVVSASKKGTIIIWNLENETYKALALNIPIADVTVSPRGDRFAVACEDRKVRFYSLQGEALMQFNAHRGGVRSVAYSSDGAFLVTASEDENISLWDAQGQNLAELRGHELSVEQALLINSNQSVLSISEDLALNLWDVKNSLYTKIEYPKNSDIWAIRCNEKGHDKQIEIWDNSGRKVLKNGELTAVATSSLPIELHKLVFFGIDDWDLTGEIISATKDQNLSALLAKDGNLITGDVTGKVQIIDHELDTTFLNAHKTTVSALAYDSTSQLLLTGSDGRSIKVWHNNQLDTVLTGHKGGISTLVFAQSGDYFASGSADGTIRLYGKDKKLRKVYVGHEGKITHIAFSKSGKLLASASLDKTVRIWETEGYEIKTITLPKAPQQICFAGQEQLFVYNTDGLLRFPVPETLSKYREQNQYEQLSISQMLELKIKYYEELKTEKELYEGAKFFFQKADLQTDLTKQIRYLVYADSLFTKLHDKQPKALYLAEHLQVALSLRNFERDKDEIDKQIAELHDQMLKAQEEEDLNFAAQLLFAKGQKATNDSAAQLNFRASEMLSRKLFIQFGKPDYLLGSYMADLMISHGKSEFASKEEDYLKRFGQFSSERLEYAANSFFYQASQSNLQWAKVRYLLFAEQLYDRLLQNEKRGDYFVNLTEVILHLQDVDAGNELKTKLQNLSIQLFGLKDAKVIQDAADRFLLKAERESSIVRKKTYLENAETLYDKLFGQKPSVNHLINKRKVLLGLRRLSPNSKSLNQKIEKNLKLFAQLSETKQLLVAINYLDREVAFSTAKEEKLKLLDVSLNLFKKLTQLKADNAYIGKMHKVVLQLRKLQPNKPNIQQSLKIVEQALDKLSGEEMLLETIGMYALWAKETNDTSVKIQYLLFENRLYQKLLQEKNDVKYLIRAWKATKELQRFNLGQANTFKLKVWQKVKQLTPEKQVKIWVEFIQNEQAQNKSKELRDALRKQLSAFLLSQKWETEALQQLSYRYLCEQAQELLLAETYDVAMLKLLDAFKIDSTAPTALAIQGLLILKKDGYRKASRYFKNKKKTTYKGKTYRAYFLDYIKQIEQEGFTHKSLSKLKRRALK